MPRRLGRRDARFQRDGGDLCAQDAHHARAGGVRRRRRVRRALRARVRGVPRGVREPTLPVWIQGLSQAVRLRAGRWSPCDRHGMGRGRDARQGGARTRRRRGRKAVPACRRASRPRSIRPAHPPRARRRGVRPPRHLAIEHLGAHQPPVRRRAGGRGHVRPLPDRLRFLGEPRSADGIGPSPRATP